MPPGFESRIRAALTGKWPYEHKCYFFKGDSYIRYDWNHNQADLSLDQASSVPSRSKGGQVVSWVEGRRFGVELGAMKLEDMNHLRCFMQDGSI